MTTLSGTRLRGNHDVEVTEAGLVSNACALDLLHALTAFMQPIVNACLSASVGLDEPHIEHDVPIAIRIAEGQELLLALQKFITTTVDPQPSGQDSNDQKDRACVRETEEPVVENAKEPALRSVIAHPRQSHELPALVLEKARRHVFNEMPIRVLSFDSSGSNLELIDRNEVLRRIISPLSSMPSDTSWYMMSMQVTNRARYAILSHTWIRDTPGDVVFSDWEGRELNPRGYDKVAKFCQVAARDHGLSLAWMDTICINKDSSSELDESIRSMYKWYRAADVCIAFLAETENIENMHSDSWFTRGWTLQELLAPEDIRFYNKKWAPLVTALDPSAPDVVILQPKISVEIQQQIQKATTITMAELMIFKGPSPHLIPFSRKMQLAANRQVTREEDEVYSLMGLLGVEISIAYGEGAKRALFRLMREVLSSTKNILDIFNHDFSVEPRTVIPSSIRQYTNRSPVFDTRRTDAISDIWIGTLLDTWHPMEPIIYTHLGVRIPLLLVPALKKGTRVGYEPCGEFSGIVTLLQGFNTTSYHLLDKSFYTEELSDILRAPPTYGVPNVLTFGILNFGADNENNILLPEDCLAIPLEGAKKTTKLFIGPSDNIKILQQRKPVVFRFQSTRNGKVVPKDELVKQGMQMVTLYLQ